MDRCIVLILYITVFICITSAANECSAANRQSNLNACLEAIRDTLQDKTKYFFGTTYETRCPPELWYTVECNISVPPGSSIVDIVYGKNAAFQPSLITKYLDVKFTSEPGSYQGCEHTFEQKQTKQFQLDPFATAGFKSWDLRKRPEVAWEVEDSDKLYTLIVLDIASGLLHAVYTNIRGDDITTATAVIPYRGPVNARAIDTVCVFFLFEQSHEVNATGSDLSAGFTIPNFASTNGMTGPIGVNFILVSQDPYAAENMRSRGVVDTCADFVGPELAVQGLPFIHPNPQMSMFVHLELTTTDITFEVCCKNYHSPGGTYVTDIFGTTQTTTAATRTGATGKLLLYPKKMNPTFNAKADLAGKLFTIMMVDPDVPWPTFGTLELPKLHWLTVNVEPKHLDNGLTLGKVIQSYFGPGPPDNTWHRYLTLVYEQNGRSSVTSAAPWIGSTTCNTCLFNASKYVTENNLQLAGATWFSATNEPYTVKIYIEGNRTTEAVACKDKPGYSNPCPASGGTTVHCTMKAFLMQVAALSGLVFILYTW